MSSVVSQFLTVDYSTSISNEAILLEKTLFIDHDDRSVRQVTERFEVLQDDGRR